MNGGVFHAVQFLGREQLRLSCEGYIYFGLSEVAAVLDAAATSQEAEETEIAFNKAYWAHAGDDAVLLERFERDFAAHPDRYSP